MVLTELDKQLLQACRNGSPEVESLLERGANPNCKWDESGNTPLHQLAASVNPWLCGPPKCGLYRQYVILTSSVYYVVYLVFL